MAAHAAVGGVIMKRVILLMIVSLPIILGFTYAPRNADSATTQNAIFEFTEKTRVGSEILLGKYYFEHDDSRMASGAPCMNVFAYEGDKQGKLVVSFHCTPVERPKSRDVIVTVGMTNSPDVFLLMEIQFKGSTKGHLVPGTAQ